jgi:phosphopantothenoylcysteine decarboxylase/phosphopantothenate--cysteine ligase
LRPRGLQGFVSVESGQEMAAAVGQALAAGAEWLVMSAAVADFAPDSPAEHKLKKEEMGTGWQLAMVRNPDILADIVPTQRCEGLKIVGFALETEDVAARAVGKLKAKNMDYVVANNPMEPGSGFGAENHRVQLLAADGIIWTSDSRPKAELAGELLAELARIESD